MIEDDLSSKLWSTDALSENSLDYKIEGFTHSKEIRIKPRVSKNAHIKTLLKKPNSLNS